MKICMVSQENHPGIKTFFYRNTRIHPFVFDLKSGIQNENRRHPNPYILRALMIEKDNQKQIKPENK